MSKWQNIGVAATIGLLIVLGLAGPPNGASAAQLTLLVGGEQHVLKKGDIQSATAIVQETGYAVSISLGKDATKLLCTLTTQHVRKKMKMLLGGKVVIDAVIQTAICGGKIIITGAFSKADAEKIARDLN